MTKQYLQQRAVVSPKWKSKLLQWLEVPR